MIEIGDSEVLRLHPDVIVTEMENGKILLNRKQNENALSVGKSAALILNALKEGKTLPEIVEQVQPEISGNKKAEALSEQIRSFLSRLAEAEMLVGFCDGVKKDSPYLFELELPNPDRVASIVAAPLKMLPLYLVLAVALALTALSLLSVQQLLTGNAFASFRDLLTPFALLVVLATLPLALFHEFFHAIVARIFSVPTIYAAVVLLPYRILPSMFVRVGPTLKYLKTRQKIAIAMAGPFADILMLGLISTVLLKASLQPGAQTALSWLFILQVLRTVINLSPATKSDVADTFEIALNFPELRQRSLARWKSKPMPPQIVFYRVLTVVYLVTLVTSVSLVGVNIAVNELAYQKGGHDNVG